ncbi:hypothetical protein EHS25_008246 [Saitozyma podzolica]|uniref:Uncharacterized protein n=1 Tax=Saitozyma podzolica TaxID=1890683 RepID=A0A427YP24_9TREE|nr:hypothetical protein EHS25_008246 [Saitozyma podzolica]
MYFTASQPRSQRGRDDSSAQDSTSSVPAWWSSGAHAHGQSQVSDNRTGTNNCGTLLAIKLCDGRLLGPKSFSPELFEQAKRCLLEGTVDGIAICGARKVSARVLEIAEGTRASPSEAVPLRDADAWRDDQQYEVKKWWMAKGQVIATSGTVNENALQNAVGQVTRGSRSHYDTDVGCRPHYDTDVVVISRPMTRNLQRYIEDMVSRRRTSSALSVGSVGTVSTTDTDPASDDLYLRRFDGYTAVPEHITLEPLDTVFQDLLCGAEGKRLKSDAGLTSDLEPVTLLSASLAYPVENFVQRRLAGHSTVDRPFLADVT